MASRDCSCLASIEEWCSRALAVLQEAIEAHGKGRSSYRGLGRLLARSQEGFGEAVKPCIENCMGEHSLRCILGDLAEYVHRQFSGIAVRLQARGRERVECIEELDYLLDTLYAWLDSICRVASGYAKQCTQAHA